MALIGKISEKKILVVVVVGIALLAFIMGTYFTGGNVSDYEESSQIGSVNGIPLNDQLFNTFKSNFEQQKLYKKNQNNQEKALQLTPNEIQEASDKAFTGLVQKTILDQQFDKIGITVSEEELDAYLYGDEEGIERHPSITQNRNFMDSTGKFSPSIFEKILNGEMAQNEEEAENIEKYVNSIKNDIIQNTKSTKYVKLLSMGMHTTQAEAEQAYKMNNASKKVKFVHKKYTDKTDVKLDDKQLREFYEKHKNDENYQQKDGSVLKYIAIKIPPSKIDFENAKLYLNNKKEEFRLSQDDSLFVVENSLEKNSSTNLGRELTGKQINYSKQGGRFGTYPESMDSEVQNAKIGSLIGPFEMMSKTGKPNMVLCKVKSIETKPTAWVRHILIGANKKDNEYSNKKALADSLKNILIQDDSKFKEFVTHYSKDPGSVQNGGEYKWFPEGQMVPEFNDFSFKAKKGKIDVVETDYGFHIVQKLGIRNSVTPTVYAISNPIKISNSSVESAKKLAYEFRKKVKSNTNNFDSISKQMKFRPQTMNLYLEKANPSVFGTAANQVMKFTFNKDQRKGDVSRPIVSEDSRGDKNIYILLLDKKLKKGPADFEDIKERMRYKATNEIIAKQLIEEMSKYKNLNDLSKQMNIDINEGEVSFDVTNIGGNNEPKVVGAIFTNLNDGELTKPIEGNSGVFVVEVISSNKVLETSDFSKEMESINNNNNSNAVSSSAMQSLLEKFTAIDDRNRNKYGAK